MSSPQSDALADQRDGTIYAALNLGHFGVKPAGSARETEARTREALQWALQRGSRSGRIAWQFAKNLAGARALKSRRPR